MQARCIQCGAVLEPEVVTPGDWEAFCAACQAARHTESGAAIAAPEFDRRGIRLPARARVGGIIIPQ
jgi:hypothetical protein